MIKEKFKKPLIMAHAGGVGHGRENSVAALTLCLEFKPDIIELDVRKSRDGVLYCYHGFPGVPFYLLAWVLHFFGFSTIRKFVEVDTLEDLLGKIDDRAIVFLDIKERGVKADDLGGICGKYKRIWIAAFSLDYLKKIREILGSACGYVYNFSFWDFEKGLIAAKKAGVDCFKLFPWQCEEKNIAAMRRAGILHTIHPLLVSEKRYKRLVAEYGSLWVAVDDMREPGKLLMQI